MLTHARPHSVLRRFGRFVLPAIVGLLAFAPSSRADDLKFKKVVLNAGSLYSATAVVDVDHDGDLDIIGGGFWYEAPSWRRHALRDVAVINGMPDGYAAQLYDVNHDGWMDFIEVNWRSSSLKWIEHPGPSLGEWTEHIIAEPGPMESGRLYDIDGDGNLDLLPNGARFAAWWQLVPKDLPDGKKTTEFIRRDLPQELAGHGIAFGDVNGDGRGDILNGKGWAEAPEDRINGTWIWHGEFEIGRVSVPFLVRDVDGDGDADLIYTQGHDYGLAWQEQIVENGERSWHKHDIDTSWSQGHYLLWEDLDQNGRMDLIAGKRFMSHGGRDPGAYDPQVIYHYEFDPAANEWSRWTISQASGIGFGLDGKAVDVDGDGDIDIVTPGRSGLYLLENQLKSPAPSASGGD